MADFDLNADYIDVRDMTERVEELEGEREAYVNEIDIAGMNEEYGKMCRAYGRDREEDNTEASVGDTMESLWDDRESYTYVWKDGKWWWENRGGGLVDLAEAVAANNDEDD